MMDKMMLLLYIVEDRDVNKKLPKEEKVWVWCWECDAGSVMQSLQHHNDAGSVMFIKKDITFYTKKNQS